MNDNSKTVATYGPNEFPPEFMHKLADIMDHCMENNTDSCSLEFEYGKRTLIVDLTFSVKNIEIAEGES